jgi:hypothetical protein
MVVVGGCGPHGRETYPAKGKVHFPDGNPLPGGIIIFLSKDKGVQARARIQDDGTFILGTLSESDGAVEGAHRVSIRPQVLDFGATPEHPILRKYYSASTSGLEFTVSVDGPNDFDILVEPLKD